MKAFRVENLKGDTIRVLVSDNVMPSSLVFSDEFRGYRILPKAGYFHDTVDHSKDEYVKGSAHTNTIENTWSLFKRGVIGIYHHVSPKHIQRYLDEFTARANTRKISDSGRVNRTLAKVAGVHLPYTELIKD